MILQSSMNSIKLDKSTIGQRSSKPMIYTNKDFFQVNKCAYAMMGKGSFAFEWDDGQLFMYKDDKLGYEVRAYQKGFQIHGKSLVQKVQELTGLEWPDFKVTKISESRFLLIPEIKS